VTITWIHLGLVLLGAVATALFNRSTQPTGSATTTGQAPVSKTSNGGAAPLANAPAGHPIIDSLVSVLESTIAQNPQLNQLEGALVTLLHPNGNINLSLTKGGSHVAPSVPAAPVSAAAALARAA